MENMEPVMSQRKSQLNLKDDDTIDKKGSPNMKSKIKKADFSLNKGARDKEMRRIMAENDSLLKRLQSRGSVYNVFEWEHDRKN